jgi:hypothetical protein
MFAQTVYRNNIFSCQNGTEEFEPDAKYNLEYKPPIVHQMDNRKICPNNHNQTRINDSFLEYMIIWVNLK